MRRLSSASCCFLLSYLLRTAIPWVTLGGRRAGGRSTPSLPFRARNSSNDLNAGADLECFPVAIGCYGPDTILKRSCKAGAIAERQPPILRGNSKLANLVGHHLITGDHFYSQCLDRFANS